jgi:hypothetical protein
MPVSADPFPKNAEAVTDDPLVNVPVDPLMKIEPALNW